MFNRQYTEALIILVTSSKNNNLLTCPLEFAKTKTSGLIVYNLSQVNSHERNKLITLIKLKLSFQNHRNQLMQFYNRHPDCLCVPTDVL